MDKRQARFVLQSHQPATPEPPDAQMAEALEQTGHDEELRAWFDRESAFDDEVRRKLREAQPPRDLKAEVLAATPVALNPAPHRNFATLAWAAAILLLASIAAFWLLPKRSALELAAFQTDMVAVAAGGIHFDYTSSDPRDLERWVNERAPASSVSLPDGLQKLHGLGCRMLTWQGQSVALVCLRLGDGRALHVFAMSRAAIRNPPGEPAAQFTTTSGMQAASWRRGDVVYVATLRGEDSGLRAQLGLERF